MVFLLIYRQYLFIVQSLGTDRLLGERDLLKLVRIGKNPVISPRPGFDWEVDGTFNPAAVAVGNTIHLLYRAVDSNRISRLGYARSSNGTEISFRSNNPVLEGTSDWEEFGCEDPRLTQINGVYFVTYTAFSRQGPRVALASTKDFTHFMKHGLIGPAEDDKDCVLFSDMVNGKIAMLHRLDSKIQIAYFDNIDSIINSKNFWHEYVVHFDDFEIIRPKYAWEEWKVGVGPPPIKTDRGWLVIYHGVDTRRVYRVGAVLLDLDEPTKILARTKEPILEPEMEFEKRGIVPNVVFPEGAVLREGDLLVYYGAADRVSCLAKTSIDEFLDALCKNESP
jgi:predicted GH43/DUF377 family glycosyl hydrolase